MSKKRAVVESNNDEVGQARMKLIKNALDKIEAAKAQGFYLESIAILESLIADRLESLISLVDKETGFQTLGNSIKKLKSVGSKFDKSFTKFIKKELHPWKDNRNKALHEMVKLEANNLHEWETRYAKFEEEIGKGIKIFRRIDKEIRIQKKKI
ncbi:MAG: hypothetical protein ACPG19_00655 [Saprospiraceae bacterium]